MPHRSSNGISGNEVLLAAEPAASPISAPDNPGVTEKVDALTKEADDLRSKIQQLETKYDTSQMTARQHDKLVKQYLLKLFDVNRQLLPLKEQMQKEAEEDERQRVRQKLEAMGYTAKTKVRHKKVRSRKVAAPKVRHKRKNAKR
jgi:hypothetical protein